jgi:hypothetical protein
MRQLKHIAKCAEALAEALDAEQAGKWAEACLGEGYAEHRENVTKLSAMVALLKDAAVRPRGGQHANLRAGQDVEAFIGKVYSAAHSVDVKLTVNRNTLDAGTLPTVLSALRPYLPQGFLPIALSPRALERIIKRDQASRRRIDRNE